MVEGNDEDELAPAPEPQTTLVQLDDEYALVFGPEAPVGLDLEPIDSLGGQSRTELARAMEEASGWANTGVQVAHGLSQAQGLVRLAPQTLEALKTAKPIADGAWNLGTLVGKNAKFVQQIRWAPAAGAQATTIVASAGTAIALLAIQAQLSRIERLVEKGLEATAGVLDVIEQGHRSAVQGVYYTLRAEVLHARQLGKVSDGIWTSVEGLEDKLRAHWELCRARMARHAGELGRLKDHRERSEFLLKRGETMIGDSQLLLMAHESWLAYRMLRVGNLLEDSDNPDNNQLASTIKEETRTEHADALRQADALLDAVSRELKLMSLLDGKRTLPFGSAKRASAGVKELTSLLQDALAHLSRDSVQLDLNRQAPELVFKEEVPENLIVIATLRLAKDETLRGIADARNPEARLWLNAPRYAILTDRRFMLAKQADFDRFGSIDSEVSLYDVTDFKVTREATDKLGATILVATPQLSLTFEYRDWTTSGTGQEKANAFTSSLRTQLLAADGPFARAEVGRRLREQKMLEEELQRRGGEMVTETPDQ